MEKKQLHTAHVRLSDGSTFTCEGLAIGGEAKEVAIAGVNKLTASLEVKKSNSIISSGSKKDEDGESGILNIVVKLSGVAAFASASTMLAIRYIPLLLSSEDKIITALVGECFDLCL